MLGDGSARVVLYALGYLAPAYYCFKSLEQQQTEKIREWCVYWLTLALFTTVERLFMDWFIFWLPFYYEAKVLFVLYLWHPKTQGALYLYTAYVQPFLVGHEGKIDTYISEAKTWVSDFLAAHFQRFTRFLQSKAHVAISALQHVQQAQMEEAQGGGRKERSVSKDSKIPGVKPKPSSVRSQKSFKKPRRPSGVDADSGEDDLDLPSVPTSKIN